MAEIPKPDIIEIILEPCCAGHDAAGNGHYPPSAPASIPAKGDPINEQQETAEPETRGYPPAGAEAGRGPTEDGPV